MARVCRPIGLLLSLLGLGCGEVEVTQITLEISTDVDCKGTGGPVTVNSVAIVAGTTDEYRRSDSDPVAVSQMCASGEIGTFVFAPSGASDANVGVRVVLGLDDADLDEEVFAEQCIQNCGNGCVESTRRLSFVPGARLRLPVRLDRNCIGVCCDDGFTCVAGECVSDRIDDCPADVCGPPPVDACPNAPGCGPMVPSGTITFSQSFGGPGDEVAKDIDERGSGYVVGGEFTQDFSVGGTMLSANGAGGIFVAAFSADGSLDWASSCAGAPLVLVAVEATSTGEVLALASAGSTVDCGGVSGSVSAESGSFLIHFGSNGQPLAVHAFGGAAGAGTFEVRSLSVGEDDVVMVAGSGTGAFSVTESGPTLGFGGQDKAFLARMSFSGTADWAHEVSLGGPAVPHTARAGSIALLALPFSGAADFDSGQTSSSNMGQDLLVSGFDLGGGLAFRFVAGGASNDDIAAAGTVQGANEALLSVTYRTDFAHPNGSSSYDGLDASTLFVRDDGSTFTRISQPDHFGGAVAAADEDVYLLTRAERDMGPRVIGSGLDFWFEDVGDSSVGLLGVAVLRAGGGPGDSVVVGSFSGVLELDQTRSTDGSLDFFIARFAR